MVKASSYAYMYVRKEGWKARNLCKKQNLLPGSAPVGFVAALVATHKSKTKNSTLSKESRSPIGTCERERQLRSSFGFGSELGMEGYVRILISIMDIYLDMFGNLYAVKKIEEILSMPVTGLEKGQIEMILAV
jgi:hypothetical protein